MKITDIKTYLVNANESKRAERPQPLRTQRGRAPARAVRIRSLIVPVPDTIGDIGGNRTILAASKPCSEAAASFLPHLRP